MRWQIDKIEILSMPRYMAIPINGIMQTTNVNNPKGIDSTEHQQLQVMALCDLHYRLHAHIVVFSQSNSLRNKFETIYERYANRGQCAHQPYFGMREMAAFFKTVCSDTKPVNYSTIIPNMLYDVFDLSTDTHQASKTLDISKVRKISLFNAEVFNGVMHVPSYETNLVKKTNGDTVC
jgi:CRISPR-associated protein Cas5d